MSTRGILPLFFYGLVPYSFWISASASAQLLKPTSLDELRDMTSEQLGHVDVIRMNLIVAREVDPSIDIEANERMVDALAAYTSAKVQTNEALYEEDKALFDGVKEKWLSVILWSVIYEDLACHYIDGGVPALDNGNPEHKFVHGLLKSRRGTCCNFPVLFLGVGQRLGWPIHGVRSPRHFYCRWEDEKTGVRFNIETTNGRGPDQPTDESQRRFDPSPDPSWERFLHVTMTSRELLGYFLELRSDVHSARKQYGRAVTDLRNSLACGRPDPVRFSNLSFNLRQMDVDADYRKADEGPLPPAWCDLPGWKSPDGKGGAVQLVNVAAGEGKSGEVGP